MKKLLRTLFILLFIGLGFLFLIKNPQLLVSQDILTTLGLEKLLTWQTATIANPASVFCLQNSWISQIVTDASGVQSWLCHLLDGTTCEERAYMRGECPIIETLLTWTELTWSKLIGVINTGILESSIWNKYLIEWSMSYPSDGIPPFIIVCAQNINSQIETCTDKQISNKKYKILIWYNLYVATWDYYVYQKINIETAPSYLWTMLPAYYSDRSECIKNDDSQKSCAPYSDDANRTPLIVSVKEQWTYVQWKIVADINPRSR